MSDLLIIDVNLTLGQWPLRRVPCDDPQRLTNKLREHHVIEAWAAHYDGLLHGELTSVNNHLSAACATASSADLKFLPFGTLNPLAANWETELDRCVATHHMRGIRLHPNYHGYALDHPRFTDLLKAATDRNLIVQLPVLMEDARMMHPLWRVLPVDLTPLAKSLGQASGVKLVVLNALTGSEPNDKLLRALEANNIYVDIATLEGAAGIERILKTIPVDRILFGSHSPIFYFESAILKLQESVLAPTQLASITRQTARRLLERHA